MRLGLLAVAAITFTAFVRGDDPSGAEVQIDGRTGAVEAME